MKVKFFCKIISKEVDHYQVFVHDSDLSQVPCEGNQTIRKVYTTAEYLPESIIYVSDSDLQESPTGKRLVINEAYSLVRIEKEEPTALFSVLEEKIKKMVLDSSFHPIDLFT
jgi:hypothetical protein